MLTLNLRIFSKHYYLTAIAPGPCTLISNSCVCCLFNTTIFNIVKNLKKELAAIKNIFFLKSL